MGFVAAMLLGTAVCPAEAPYQTSLPSHDPIVAIVGNVAQPGAYRLPHGAVMADLVLVGGGAPAVRAETQTYETDVTLVRNGQMMKPVPPGHALRHGDVLLISPAYDTTTRNVAVLTGRRTPLVISLPPGQTSVRGAAAILGLSSADGALQVAPQSLASGELADGSAILLPDGEAGTRVFNRLVSQCPIYDATAIASASEPAPQPIASAAATPPLPQVVPSPKPTVRAAAVSSASTTHPNARTDARLTSLATPHTPLPADPLATKTAMAGSAVSTAGPMSAARVCTPNGSAGLPCETEPNSGRPLPGTVPPFPIPVPVASPAGQPTAFGDDRVSSLSHRDQPARRSVFAEPGHLVQTAAVGPERSFGPSLTELAERIEPLPAADAPAAPRSLDVRSARRLEASAPKSISTETAGLVRIEPSASRLGGVMFASIVLVVACGGLMVWSRGSMAAATPQPVATAMPEPASIAPIIEEPAVQTPQVSLHGDVVGLDKLRVDAAHPISPPHYARTAQRPAREMATAGPSDSRSPIRPPHSGRPAPPQTDSAEQPGDLLARALQAMQREVRP